MALLRTWKCAAYYGVEDSDALNAVTDRDIYTVGLGYNFDKNTNLYGEYMKASDELVAGQEDDGYAVTLSYKGAKAAKVNTWGMSASYYDQTAATIIDHTTELYGDIKGGDAAFKGGFKGLSSRAQTILLLKTSQSCS